MTFTVTINCDNEAFGEDLEERETQIVLILHRLIRSMASEPYEKLTYPLLDTNGNRVGQAMFSDRS